MNANRRKRILSAGLWGNLISGMFFGTGCLIVEHIDSQWFNGDDNAQQETTSEPKVADRNLTPSADRQPVNHKHLAQRQSKEDRAK